MTDSTDKPLIEKLGFTSRDSVYVETTPGWYTKFADENGLELEPGLPATHAHMFCVNTSELSDFVKNNDLNQVKKSIWISWPKQGSKLRNDLHEHDIRAALLPLGWVDTKVASIDTDWSGLKFLRRKG